MSDAPLPVMEPFGVFQVYHAVFLHFTTDYDYQKYKGKTSYKKETFEHRKDKYSYHKLVRCLEYYDYKYLEYYLAWLFLTEDNWVTTKTIEEKVVAFENDWRNYSTARSSFLVDDIAKIGNTLDAKKLFDLLRPGEIHLQSLLILDQMIKGGVIEKMNNDLRGNYLWDGGYKKLIKFRPFYLTHEPIHEIHFKPYIPETLKWVE